MEQSGLNSVVRFLSVVLALGASLLHFFYPPCLLFLLLFLLFSFGFTFPSGRAIKQTLTRYGSHQMASQGVLFTPLRQTLTQVWLLEGLYKPCAQMTWKMTHPQKFFHFEEKDYILNIKLNMSWRPATQDKDQPSKYSLHRSIGKDLPTLSRGDSRWCWLLHTLRKSPPNITGQARRGVSPEAIAPPRNPQQ